ncbi:MAG: agmatine deiminase family protein [Tannerellaceae bacterium]|jgi:agmatine/peptidylarginine deiminase|nr:agmatine deiminase family protein [Tannerellaceae bacterium]
MEKQVMPAEWEEQSGVMLAWPEAEMDWGEDTEEARVCYGEIMEEISRREKVILLRKEEVGLNDTWTRDYAPLAIRGGSKMLVDFRFDGWGGKFVASSDDAVGGKLFRQGGVFAEDVAYMRKDDVVCEGGNLDTDGQGTLLSSAICAGKRYPYLKREQWEAVFGETLGIDRTLWVEEGLLEGDDTDGHIDTLVRFADANTLLYTKCKSTDSHFAGLKRMEEQLHTFTRRDGSPYRLQSLPLPSPILHKGERLPATYANFLFINGGVLVPVYGVDEDAGALDIFRRLFPRRRIRGIDCSALLRQHGSLHCATMQFPQGFLRDGGEA